MLYHVGSFAQMKATQLFDSKKYEVYYQNILTDTTKTNHQIMKNTIKLKKRTKV